METAILIPGNDGYSTRQCGHTMTVGELIAELENFDEETKVYLSTGQQYGIQFTSLRTVDSDYEDEDENEEDQ